jgi:hypothetical protein
LLWQATAQIPRRFKFNSEAASVLRLLADTAAVLAAGNTKAQKDELKIKGEPVPFFKDTRILY